MRRVFKKTLSPFYLSASLFVAVIGVVATPFPRLLRRLIDKRFNSLWTGTPILTLPLNARAEAMLGVNAKSLVYESFGITRGGFDIHLGRWLRIPILGRLVPFVTFLYACVTQDRLHFFTDRGIIPLAKIYNDKI